MTEAIRKRALNFAIAMAKYDILDEFDAHKCISIKSESPPNPEIVEKFGTLTARDYLEFEIEIDYKQAEIKTVNEKDAEIVDFLLRTGMQLTVTCNEFDVIHYQIKNIDLD
ncbi:MAG: hypothetical protein HUJ26_02625 [Planctomycetaceae bacterium]|nr:hypothetical protein [Planctomycetaceae bacterium]